MSKTTLSYDGIGRMLTASWMQGLMARHAEPVKELAEATAPYDPNDKDDDHYRDHFKVESGVLHRKTSRAFAAVVNDHPASVSIEFGQRKQEHNTPAHHTLLRSIDAAKGL